MLILNLKLSLFNQVHSGPCDHILRLYRAIYVFMCLYPVGYDSDWELAILKEFIPRLLNLWCQPVSETVAVPFGVGYAHVGKQIV